MQQRPLDSTPRRSGAAKATAQTAEVEVPENGSESAPENGPQSTPEEGAEETSERGGLRAWIPRHRKFLSWLVVVLILSLTGTALGPGWHPQPMEAVIQPETPNTAIGTAGPTAPVGTYAVETEVVTFRLRDGTENQATIKKPVGARGPLPGMVFIHGTGTDSYTAFERETNRIASTGIVTMVAQKRIANYTTTHRDYNALADDYEDALEFLREQAGIDPGEVGIYAVSEGCFVAPIIAARNYDVAYVAFISAPVLPIRQQGAFAADAYLREIGAPIQIINAIPKILGQDFGEETFRYIDFDPAAYEAKITAPVMMLYGTADKSMPTIQGPLVMAKQLEKAGNRNLTIRYYEGADHGLQLNRKTLSEAAMQDVSDWVNGLPYTANSQPRVAGGQPNQQYQAGAVQEVPTFLNGEVVLAVMAAGILLAALAWLLQLIGLIRVGNRGPLAKCGGSGGQLNRSLAWTVITWVAYLWYVLLIARIALNYQQDRLLVQGGYLIIVLLALSAAWWFVSWLFRWAEVSKQSGMNAFGQVISAVALLSQIALLLTLGYWNAFPGIF
ncbi:alpha/beta hydrolase family protein [Actinobaculum suis]|uniref:alpha/beta hydrolase family protein n=1 Tax=Actinobaculum suis TaxID=1657 RepID=UPI0009E49FAA|nr:acyl-CoA thioester hydrolase/BAAT C-terminal domain-containing protein [Actinobaculum suis]